MRRETDPGPRSRIVLTAAICLDGIRARLAGEVSEPDPDALSELAQRLRTIADLLDEHNITRLHVVPSTIQHSRPR